MRQLKNTMVNCRPVSHLGASPLEPDHRTAAHGLTCTNNLKRACCAASSWQTEQLGNAIPMCFYASVRTVWVCGGKGELGYDLQSQPVSGWYGVSRLGIVPTLTRSSNPSHRTGKYPNQKVFQKMCIQRKLPAASILYPYENFECKKIHFFL